MQQGPRMDLIRAIVGTSDLLNTEFTARLELGSPPHPSDLVVYKVLGARQIAQAVLTAQHGRRQLWAVVDLLHLATMLPVLVLVPRWRRAALVQAGLAGLLIVLALRAD